jgi:hypothetical protein
MTPPDNGQASVELIAAVPALVLAGLVALQLLAAGYAMTLADGAAEAGALAVAAGRDPAPAVADALPGWAEERFSLDAEGGRVRVTVRPPGVPGITRYLEVAASAWARPAEADR